MNGPATPDGTASRPRPGSAATGSAATTGRRTTATRAIEAAAEPGDVRLLGRVRRRLVLWSGVLTLALLLALGATIYLAVSTSLASAARTQLDERAEPIVDVVRTLGTGLNRGAGPRTGFLFGGRGSATVALVVAPSGLAVGDRDVGLTGLPVSDGVTAARTGRTDERIVTLQETRFRVISIPVERTEGTYVVQVLADTTAEDRTLGVLLAVLVVGGLVAFLASLALGGAYASRALVPIRDSLRRQREFAADASHELRTPLAVIRASVDELVRRGDRPVRESGPALGDIRAEVDHLTGIVDDLLLLARSDSGAVSLERIPTDLAGVAEEALPPLAGLAGPRDVRVVLDPAPAPVVGDPVRLRQLVTILVDNAIRHSPAGGNVTVRVRPEGSGATLAVEDEGPGIREEDLPRVFDRFYRAPDAPTGGTGLGLAIAAWIAERHGGTIEAGNRPDGGARFAVRLPAG